MNKSIGRINVKTGERGNGELFHISGTFYEIEGSLIPIS